MINIDKLILEATKAQDITRKNTYRLIKADFMKYSTSKDAIKKPLDEIIQLNIINKFVNACKETVTLCGIDSEVGSEANEQMLIAQELLPAPITRETLDDFLKKYLILSYPGGITKKDMGNVIKAVKSEYPTADGKLISELVVSKIHN